MKQLGCRVLSLSIQMNSSGADLWGVVMVEGISCGSNSNSKT